MSGEEADSLIPGEKFGGSHGNRWHDCVLISRTRKGADRYLKHTWIDSRGVERVGVIKHKNAMFLSYSKEEERDAYLAGL